MYVLIRDIIDTLLTTRYFFIESKEVTIEMATMYLKDPQTDGLTSGELTQHQDVIPVEEDGRLYHFLQQRNYPYEVKPYGNGHFILVKEAAFDEFNAIRESFNGIVLLTPPVMRFISERKLQKFDILSHNLIKFDPILYESYDEWCQRLLSC